MIFTVDQDATIIESRKREALYTYEGSRGYQPMLAVWAEMDVVLADEFRDGNVPAQMAPLTVAQAAFAAAPTTVTSALVNTTSAVVKTLVDQTFVEHIPLNGRTFQTLIMLRNPHSPAFKRMRRTVLAVRTLHLITGQ